MHRNGLCEKAKFLSIILETLKNLFLFTNKSNQGVRYSSVQPILLNDPTGEDKLSVKDSIDLSSCENLEQGPKLRNKNGARILKRASAICKPLQLNPLNDIRAYFLNLIDQSKRAKQYKKRNEERKSTMLLSRNESTDSIPHRVKFEIKRAINIKFHESARKDYKHKLEKPHFTPKNKVIIDKTKSTERSGCRNASKSPQKFQGITQESTENHPTYNQRIKDITLMYEKEERQFRNTFYKIEKKRKNRRRRKLKNLEIGFKLPLPSALSNAAKEILHRNLDKNDI